MPATLITLLLLGLTLPMQSEEGKLLRTTGILILILFFGFFASLSLRYDFMACVYPSREAPFFISGRLMSGMLLPFVMLLSFGLIRISKWIKTRAEVVIIGFALSMLFLEIWATLPRIR